MSLGRRNRENFICDSGERTIRVRGFGFAQGLGDMAKEGQGRYDLPRIDLGIYDGPQRRRAIAPDLTGERIGNGQQSRTQLGIAQERLGLGLVLDGKSA
jgi:hypothetical protein